MLTSEFPSGKQTFHKSPYLKPFILGFGKTQANSNFEAESAF